MILDWRGVDDIPWWMEILIIFILIIASPFLLILKGVLVAYTGFCQCWERE